MRVLAFTLLLVFVGASLQQEQTPTATTKGCLANVVAFLSTARSFEIQKFVSGEKYSTEVIAVLMDAVKACFGSRQKLASVQPVPVSGYLDSCAELLKAAEEQRKSALAWAAFFMFENAKRAFKISEEYYARYNRGDCIKP